MYASAMVPRDPNDIINSLVSFLDIHFKGGTSIGQLQYKAKFFDLFEEAYRSGHLSEKASPRLTGDALREVLTTRWIDGKDKKQNRSKRKLIDDLLARWDEWRYAWDRFPRT
jgi:hypothetical protein